MHYGVALFLLLFCPALCSASDSLKIKKPRFPGFTYSSTISASYISYKNWKYNGFNSFSFLTRQNLNYDKTGKKMEIHFRINGELSYLKFLDSILLKNNDLLDLNLELLKATNKKISHSFVLNFYSQFISDKETWYNDLGEPYERWSGGFGNPMSLDLCYGSTLKVWKNSRLVFSYVCLHTLVEPRLEMELPTKEKLLVLDHAFIDSRYGFTLQSFIRHKFAERLRWENNSRLFANGISANDLDFDLRNRLIIHLLKHLDLIIDTKLRYLPVEPYKVQFRNELMLSFTMERM